MTHRTLAVVLVASLLAACASGKQPSAREGAPAPTRMRESPFDTTPPNMKAARVLAGCYSVSVGAWSNERAVGAQAAIPSRIQLDTARHNRPRPGFELVAQTIASGQRREVERLSSWSPVGADSLQVAAWANSTSSVDLFLRRRAEGVLEGTARYFWDQIFLDPVTKRWLWEGYPTAPATLTAVSCN